MNCKFCCRAVPDDRFGVLNNPTCTNIGFSLSSLSREEGILKRNNKIFVQSPGSQYLVLPGKLLLKAATSVNGRILSTL